MACANSSMLTTMAATVIMLGVRRVKPWVYFRPIAHTTSSKPAISRIIQAMNRLRYDGVVPGS
ncbi:hypothetical protein D3C75_1378530 [compost metagenome]